MKKLRINLGKDSYDVSIGRGLLSSVGDIFNLSRKVLVVTDDGVPAEYANTVAAACREAKIVTVHEGEGAKSPEVLSELLSAMVEFGMGRGDCAVAVGGGVVGDLCGFAAACYMRGIDFYNLPTTLLSMVDSSIGGKTAINYGGIKNIVGAFHQPRGVIVDVDTLRTLPERQISNGLAEAVKMSLTSDRELFEKFEALSKDEILDNIEDIIVASLKIKRDVVECDEKESGLRKILNFGHTFGHGVEAECEMKGMYHGECVAVGMIPMVDEPLRKRLIPVLKRLGLPTRFDGDVDRALSFVIHDKKCSGGRLDVILVHEPGKYEIRGLSVDEFAEMIKSKL